MPSCAPSARRMPSELEPTRHDLADPKRRHRHRLGRHRRRHRGQVAQGAHALWRRLDRVARVGRGRAAAAAARRVGIVDALDSATSRRSPGISSCGCRTSPGSAIWPCRRSRERPCTPPRSWARASRRCSRRPQAASGGVLLLAGRWRGMMAARAGARFTTSRSSAIAALGLACHPREPFAKVRTDMSPAEVAGVFRQNLEGADVRRPGEDRRAGGASAGREYRRARVRQPSLRRHRRSGAGARRA